MPDADTHKPRPIVILGPTAGGKSELAVALAQRCAREGGIKGEVIGADSMQIYKQMDAGTAKPSPEQQARATHHLIDIVEPTERFTVADWLALADDLLDDLPKRGITPIVVGGTNLYMKALLEGMFEGPPLNEALREALYAMTNEQLRQRLLAIDAPAAQRIHINDRKRTVRAIEVYEQTGRRISDLQTQWEGEGEEGQGPRAKGQGGEKQQQETGRSRHDVNPPSAIRIPQSLGPWPLAPGPSRYRHNPTLIGLHWPTELINPRINLRVKEMFFPAACGFASESLPDETRRLESANRLGPQARKALGYQQVLDAIAGRCSPEEAFERTKILTRRFAKSQRTWLKRYQGVYWLDASILSPRELADAAWRAVRAAAEV
ncbi:MAG: tRNA (adenosine(37)-N6)-dimethylallyltransferase MiaA [Phycisphaeraceae bacterium]